LRKLWIAISLVLLCGAAAAYLIAQRPSALEEGRKEAAPAATKAPAQPPIPLPATPPEAGRAEDKRMVVYTAEVELKVEELEEARAAVESKVRELGGYISESRSWSDRSGEWTRITAKIPVDHFESFISWVKKLGKLERESTRGYDVTMEYIDLQARLSNLKATEERLLKLLDRAETVEDVLKVEAELTRVRSEIESLEGRIKYLEHHTEMATVTVALHKPKPTPLKPEVSLRETLANAVSWAIKVAIAIITLTIALSPLAAATALGYLAYKKLKKKATVQQASGTQ